METLDIHPSEEMGVMIDEMEREKIGEQDEASSPMGSTTDEEADEDSEPEPPPVVRRKVSFADAFGLDLVSVKEFDNAEVTEAEISWSDERPAVQLSEEFNLSCLFACPSSPEELDQRLQTQMVELESIELLPGTTTIRGIVRVVNLCYSKSVYARISMDQWRSYFDLLAEYVPGSSDRKTDRFTFRYTLIPPFEKEGTRVEFCLRYETSVGTFWANNRNMNYVLFCHQKGHVTEHVLQTQEENSSYKSKRSCLRANRNGTTEEKTKETTNTNTVSAAHNVESAGRETMDDAETQLQLRCEEHKPWVESVKSRRRATRLAHVQDYLSQKRQQQLKAYSRDSDSGQKVSQRTPAPWGDSASFLYKCQKMQLSKSPPVLTYHQIPLLPLDWNNDTPQKWGMADVEDILTGRGKSTLSKASKENTPSVNDMWETFSKSTDAANNKEASVSDTWQVFLNGPSCKDHSNVPESEWLQTAASVSPSHDKPPQIQYAARSQDFVGLQVGTYTPITSHTLAACQLLSDACETSSATGALNAEDQQPAEACVTGVGDDNPAAQDAFQRSQKNSVTDTPQEFCLKRASPVSKDSVDSPTECHKHAVWERESEGIIGRAEGIGGDEPVVLHTADLVTSSGESGTTDLTALPESQNASAVDGISQGARQDEGLSSIGEGEVTCTTHNAIDDMLAFRETIRQEAKDGEMCVFSNARQEAEEGITMNYMEKKASTGEAIYRPQMEEYKISPRYADESQCEKLRLTQNSENPLQLCESGGREIRLALSRTGRFDPNQTCGESFVQNRAVATEMIDSVPSNNLKTDASRETLSGGTEGLSCSSVGTNVSAELAWRHNDSLQLNSTGQVGSQSLIFEACDKQSRSFPAGEEMCIQTGEDLVLTQTEQRSELKYEKGQKVLNQSGKGKILSCDEKAVELQEINPSVQTRLTEYSMEVSDYSIDRCNPNLLEVVEQQQTDVQQDLSGQKQDLSSELNLERDLEKENVTKEGTSTEHEPEKSEGIEGDMSQEDERVSVGKLKTEAMRESKVDVETPLGEKGNAMKKGELSAEVESPLCVEYKKLSEGAKDPIRAENTVSLEAIEPRLEPMFIERFEEDLVRRILEEVFLRVVQPSERHTNTVDEMRRKLTDTAQACHLILEKDLSDTLVSGVFSLTGSETGSNLSLCQGPEQTFVIESSESSPKDTCHSLASTEQTHILPELHFDLDSSAHLRQNITTTSAALSGQSLSESGQALRSPEDQENCCQIKERSIPHKETSGQMEDHVATHKESVHQSVHLSHKHQSSFSERVKESDVLFWWTILYSVTHITLLLICTFLVCGFFVTVFLCDSPSFFALYMFSLCLWAFKWKRDHVRPNKGMVG